MAMKKTVLALDIGGTNTRAAIVDEDYHVLCEKILPTKRGNVNDFMEQIYTAIDELHYDISTISAIGAGVPGVVNRDTGYIYTLPNVDISDIPLGELLLQKYHKKLFLRNDAEVACLGEATIGKGKDYSATFFITISTGLGGSLTKDGHVQDYITEIGHTTFIYKDKPFEYEFLASGTGIVNLAKLHNLDIHSAKELFLLKEEKNQLAILVYNEWLNILTSFLQLINNSYEPDIFVFTGGVFKSKEYFFEDLRLKNDNLYLEECDLKESAGLLGAAVYALQNI